MRFFGHSCRGLGNKKLAYALDGTSFVFAGGAGLHRWNIQTGQALVWFQGSSHVESLVLCPDGRHVLTGSCKPHSHDYPTMQLWDAESGEEVRRFEGHKGGVRSVDCSPNGRFVVSGSDDKTVRLWETESGRELYCFEGHTDEITSVAFSPIGRFIVSSSQDKTVRLWGIDQRIWEA
jgi:WD40 repeat protein